MSFVRTALAPLPARKRIALVAHDHEKAILSRALLILSFFAACLGAGCVSRPSEPTSAQAEMVTALFQRTASAKQLPVYLDESEKRRIYHSLAPHELEWATRKFLKGERYIGLVYALAGRASEEEFIQQRIAVSWPTERKGLIKTGSGYDTNFVYLTVFSPYRDEHVSLEFNKEGLAISLGDGNAFPKWWFVGENPVAHK
ncbi:MAG: hypothetical protein QM760_03680 [Nibricoccus sp.]